MRLAFAGTDGPLSVAALAAAARDHEIVAVVRPPRRGGGARARLRRLAGTLGRPPGLDGPARRLGVAVTEVASPADPALRSVLERTRPDLLCVAGFPWLLGREVLAAPALGAINVHAALLPRHRGVLPLFWIYHADDRETGVTVHWMNERADAGDVVFQAAFPLPRGFPVEQLNLRNADTAGPLLTRALAAIAAGDPPREAQDEALATLAPFVRAGTRMVAFDAWGAERVWHFLAGLHPRFTEPLTDGRGEAVRYRGVRGWAQEAHRRRPGSVERGRRSATLFCRDGIVTLDT